MADRRIKIVPLLLLVSFSIVAFVFSILTITSSKWAQRDYYDDADPIHQTSPNFTITRSPFKVCTARPTFVQSPSSDPDGEPSVVLTGYTHSCMSFASSGQNQTSCEVLSVTQYDGSITNGDARLCQQVHYAGNFGITSTIFISLGFIIALALGLFTALGLWSNNTTSHEKTHTEGAVTDSDQSKLTRAERSKRHILSNNAAFLIVLFLTIGAVLAVISQFYGILAFIQSSPNNADYASSAAGNAQSTNSNTAGYHGPWYQGDALSVYMTCSWGFALAGVAMTFQAFNMPRWIAF